MEWIRPRVAGSRNHRGHEAVQELGGASRVGGIHLEGCRHRWTLGGIGIQRRDEAAAVVIHLTEVHQETTSG